VVVVVAVTAAAVVVVALTTSLVANPCNNFQCLILNQPF
jgi:hypothetical protein